MTQETIDPLAVRAASQAFAEQLADVTAEERRLFAEAVEASALQIRDSGKRTFCILATNLVSPRTDGTYELNEAVAAAAEAAGIDASSVPLYSGIWLDVAYGAVASKSGDRFAVWRHATLPMPSCKYQEMSIADAYPNLTSGLDVPVDHLPTDRRQCVLELFHVGQHRFPARNEAAA